MTDTELLRQYQEWRAGNEGRMVDVSPEAFALQKAINDLVLAMDGDNDNWRSDGLAGASEVIAAWEALNAPTD